MVVALHTTRTCDGCPLEEASFSVENEGCPAMEYDFATPKKKKQGKRQRRRVSFALKETIKIIPSTDDFTKEEKEAANFTSLELQLIRVRLRTEIMRHNQLFISSSAKELTAEQEQELRGLEAYAEPTKHTIAMRRQQTKDVVFQKDCDAEWIAEKCQEITATACDVAHKVALMDEQQAWSTDDAEENADGSECFSSQQRAPLYQIMIR